MTRGWAGDYPSISLGLWVPGGLLEPRPPLVVLTGDSEKGSDGLTVTQGATPELGSWSGLGTGLPASLQLSAQRSRGSE